MSINQANITAQVSRFSTLIEQWKNKQPQVKGFTRPLSEVGPGVDRSGKDVIVALRTRPPIPSERERFIPTAPEEGAKSSGDESAFDFCIGVDVRSAEPGKMVAHVPAMKVSLKRNFFWSPRAFESSDDCPYVVEWSDSHVSSLSIAFSSSACLNIPLQPQSSQKAFDADLAFDAQITNEEVYKRTVEAHSVRSNLVRWSYPPVELSVVYPR